MSTEKKYALITGATSGIGYELAKLFAKDGYNLITVARDSNELSRTAEEFSKEGIEVIPMAKDLFDVSAASEIYQEVKSKGIEIDVLVNDAGQGEFGKFIENDLERELSIIQLNVMSLVALTKYFVKDMVQRGSGKLLNLSSIAGKVPGPYQAVYHGTKSFVDAFTVSLYDELKDSGVTVTALLPGATDTDFFNKADMNNSKIVKTDLADPAKVAKDGYDALMSGDPAVISGLKNKMFVGMGNALPDDKAAAIMREQQKPVDKD